MVDDSAQSRNDFVHCLFGQESLLPNPVYDYDFVAHVNSKTSRIFFTFWQSLLSYCIVVFYVIQYSLSYISTLRCVLHLCFLAYFLFLQVSRFRNRILNKMKSKRDYTSYKEMYKVALVFNNHIWCIWFYSLSTRQLKQRRNIHIKQDLGHLRGIIQVSHSIILKL